MPRSGDREAGGEARKIRAVVPKRDEKAGKKRKGGEREDEEGG